MSRPTDDDLELPGAETDETSPAQREELDRRWLDLQKNPNDEEPWDDVMESLRNEAP